MLVAVPGDAGVLYETVACFVFYCLAVSFSLSLAASKCMQAVVPVTKPAILILHDIQREQLDSLCVTQSVRS